jgi:hypothetical protein
MTINLQGHASDFGNILAAISALGAAAFGLVDATKVYRGGVSNIGFGFVKNAVTPYVAALRLVSTADPFATIKANWLNGVAKADQKATVKSLIRLGLTTATVGSLAAGAPGVDAAALQTAAAKVDAGTPLGEQDISALGRFDAIVDAQMDAGFERADQQYRNAAKVLAAVFAIVLALLGVWLIDETQGNPVNFSDFMLALFVGAIATPLAPVAKDLTSAIGSAVTALKAVKS